MKYTELSSRDRTIAEFVVAFHDCEAAKEIEYATLLGVVDWCDYVELLASAGACVSDVFALKFAGVPQKLDDWYYVLDDLAQALAMQLVDNLEVDWTEFRDYVVARFKKAS